MGACGRIVDRKLQHGANERAVAWPCLRTRCGGVVAAMNIASLRRTGLEKWLLVPRLIVALPLVVFGSFHLTGRSPLMEILLRADIPWPELNFYLAPLFMVISGLSVGLGFYARIGAVIAAFAMLVATYSKLVIEEWPGPMEPPLALPLVVLAGCLIVLIKGAGAWSLDYQAQEHGR